MPLLSKRLKDSSKVYYSQYLCWRDFLSNFLVESTTFEKNGISKKMN